MRAVWLLVIAMACGGAGVPRRAPIVPAGDVVAAANVEKMTSLLRGHVVNGGLWFEDASCANQFAAGELEPALRSEFARCLVHLELRPSTRTDQLADVAVMTYGPGFEVEARIVREPDGPRLSWIGFASRSAGDDKPTISRAALEALRLTKPEGLPTEVLDALAAEPTARMGESPDGTWQPTSTGFHFTWLKVCLDPTGAVTSVVPYETTSATHQDAFVAAARAWRFRPFRFANQPIAVCAMVRFEAVRGSAPPEQLPLPLPPRKAIVLAQATGPLQLEGRRVAGNQNIVPTDLSRRKLQPGTRLEGAFRVCVDETGAVDLVVPLLATGLAEYDQRLLAGIRGWRFTPFQVNGMPVSVCTRTSFVFISGPMRVIRH